MDQQYLFTDEAVGQLSDAIGRARRVTVVCHLSPDGDALGSSLAVVRLMRSLGKEAVLVTPDLPPEYLSFMPGFCDIIVGSCKPDRAFVTIRNCDLLLCLDFNSLKRIDRMAPAVKACCGYKVMVDHHLNPDLEVDLAFSCPEQSSTCVLLYRLLDQAGLAKHIDREGAECLLTGIMTDTGGLAYNSLDPQLYLVIAQLVARGADKDMLYRLLFRTRPLNQILLNSFALSQRMTMFPDHRAALIVLSSEDLRRFDYVKGLTEGLVNVPLEVPDIIYSVFLREDLEERYVKVSMRSKGDFPVDRICSECFGGGGHLNAAGGEIRASLDEAVRAVTDAMPLYDKYLPRDHE